MGEPKKGLAVQRPMQGTELPVLLANYATWQTVEKLTALSLQRVRRNQAALAEDSLSLTLSTASSTWS